MVYQALLIGDRYSGSRRRRYRARVDFDLSKEVQEATVRIRKEAQEDSGCS